MIDLARRPASGPRAPLGLALALVILTAAVTGLRPEPLLSGARPVVERMLSGEAPGGGSAAEIRR